MGQEGTYGDKVCHPGGHCGDCRGSQSLSFDDRVSIDSISLHTILNSLALGNMVAIFQAAF